METVVANSIGRPRLMSALTALFGGLAGLLAMIGIYGVISRGAALHLTIHAYALDLLQL